MTDGTGLRGDLGSIGSSASLVAVGIVVGQFVGFLTRVVMTRVLSVADYGLVTVGITVVTFAGTLSLAGFEKAVVRYLPRFDDPDERAAVVATVYRLSLALGAALGATLFLAAQPLAVVVFDDPGLIPVLRVAALVLPFYALYRISINGVQGLERTRPNVALKEIALPVGRLALVTLAVLAGAGAVGIAGAYLGGFAVVGVVALAVFVRMSRFRIRDLLARNATGRRRELLTFSLPLAVTGGLGIVARQSDVLILAAFRSSDVVGVYDIAFLMASFLLFVSTAVDYLFHPIVSRHDSDEDRTRITTLYTVTTRWIVVGSYPLFLLFFLFPSTVLGTIFGPGYVDGALALAVLALGFYVTRLPGLTGSLLIARGRTRTMMGIATVSEVTNVVANLVLIPLFGLLGAAVATAGSRTLNNALQAAYLYREEELHPFRRTLWMPLLGMVPVTVVGAAAVATLELGGVPAAVVVVGVLTAVFVGLFVVSRSIYVVEAEIAESLLDRLGLEVDIVDRFDDHLQEL